jgi:hypothetical protein
LIVQVAGLFELLNAFEVVLLSHNVLLALQLLGTVVIPSFLHGLLRLLKRAVEMADDIFDVVQKLLFGLFVGARILVDLVDFF